jgi:DNA-binding SARP family transcriptional activator/tetratricopeptide (TPR) repeat protein
VGIGLESCRQRARERVDVTAGFTFAILGPVRAWHDGIEIDLGTPQRQAILALLLLRAGVHVPADEIVDALWPDDPPKTAIATVRTYVHRLRRVLGGEELLRSAGSGYVFAPQGDDLDVTRFRGLIKQAAGARAKGDVDSAANYLAEALTLWRGAPLAEIAGRFAETQRALLEEMRLTATEDKADAELTLGRHAQVIPDLAALARECPYRERVSGLLMLALYRAGRQAEALSMYDEVRHLLATELGVDPGPQLRDLHLRILNADPGLMDLPTMEDPGVENQGGASKSPTDEDAEALPSRPPQEPPAQLPRDLPTFVGRRDDVELVLAGLTGEAGPGNVTVVAGMAGVGKTTLAVHAGHLLADRFPDGQLYIDLRGFDRSGLTVTPQDAICQLLAGLEVPPSRIPAGAQAQIGLYRSIIAGRRVLIVLDNARNAEQVRPLLPGNDGCRVLVTSRDQMRSLIAIDAARLVALSPFDRDDARETLSRRLGAARVNVESEAVERLIDLCAGLPLALSAIAARASIHATDSLSSIATELSESGNSLNALADPDSVIDARASLSLSYRTLSATAARALRLSSLHPGTKVSKEAMASLTGATMRETAASLDELERAHLMGRPEPGLYASHDLVRAYAAELADSDPVTELDSARKRMLDYYRQSSYAAMRTLRPLRSPVSIDVALPGVTITEFSHPKDAFGWLSRAYPVLRVLLDQTVNLGLPEYTWQLAWALDPFYNNLGRWQEKVHAHRVALAAAEALGNLALQGHSHRNLGQAFRLLGDQQQAMNHLKLAQSLYGEIGDRADQARNLSHIVTLIQCGNPPRPAMKEGLRALDLSIAAGDPALEAVALNNLACAHSMTGDQATAIDLVDRALALLDRVAERTFRGHALCTLGQCRYRNGDYEEALPRLQEALDIFRAHHDWIEEANTLRLLAMTQRRGGNMVAAQRSWQAALPLLGDLGRDLPTFDAFTLEDAADSRR